VIDRVRDGRASGVLLFGDNLANRSQAAAEMERVQAAAAVSPGRAPAIVAADQEGGIVARVPGPPAASASDMGSWPPDRIRSEAADTAANLLTWGINTDLAPVSDVARTGGFIDAQHRSFSPDPDVAATAVGAFVEGLRDGGVASVLKHAPGLGAATVNTDDAISSIDLSLDEIRAIDLVPVQAGVDAGADVVMVSSAVYSMVDDQPAVLSPDIVDHVVRDELGFDGVIMSDALDTPSLAHRGSVGEIALRAAKAGVDLFIATDPGACATIQASLERAISSGEVSHDAALASYRRILAVRRTLAP
jgi:beta-N-acetylhexosaminidase